MLKIKLSFPELDYPTYQSFVEAFAPWLAEAKLKPPMLDPKTGLYRVFIELKKPPRNGKNT